MSFAFLVAAFLAASGPARWRHALLGLAAGVVAIAVADPLLDLLAISPESWRIAAGLVLTAAGLAALVRARPARDALPPALVVLAVAAGADEATARAVLALAAGLAAAVVVGRPRAPAARLLGAVEVAAGVALVVSGIRDV